MVKKEKDMKYPWEPTEDVSASVRDDDDENARGEDVRMLRLCLYISRKGSKIPSPLLPKNTIGTITLPLLMYSPLLPQKPVEPEQNFVRAAAAIRAAATAGCHLAVLPEYHLTAWAPEHPGFAAACAASEAYLGRYQALARECAISIVPGTICERYYPEGEDDKDNDEDEDEKDEDEMDEKEKERGTAGATKRRNPQLRNMAHFISAGTGAIAGSYQKKNLWHPERPHLSPGKHEPHAAFDTPLRLGDDPSSAPVRAGLLICWDLAFPEAFRALIADGAQLIIVPSFWQVTDLDEVGRALNPDSEKVFLDAAVVSRAFENTACVVFCNKGGCSQVAMPIQGKLQVLQEGESRELGLDEDGVSYVEVDLDVLRIAEENYKVRGDIKGKGWHYGYELAK